MLIQVRGLKFITLEASGREIYFSIDVWNWYLKLLQTWSKAIEEIRESWLDIHKIEEKTI